MGSEAMGSNIPKRLIASCGVDRIVIRALRVVPAIGKILMAHILLDRGLGANVPVYWAKIEAVDLKRKLMGVWRVSVKTLDTI